MKIPLKYQSTEYDCGPTAVTNGINFLFDRENIPPEVIRNIMLYSLDAYDRNGEAGKMGTTGMAMLFLSNWLNQFGKVKKWPINASVITGESVFISQNSEVITCLQSGGAVVAKVMLGVWHYVLLTGVDEEYIYLFDPYYRKRPFKEEGVTIINNDPTKLNRKVKREIFNSQGKENYAFGTIEERECVLLYNTATRKTVDDIEYII